MPVIAVNNAKGGVGKTTSSINLAEAWRRSGANTLLIDHDPGQSSASRWKRVADENGRETVSVVSVGSDLSKVVRDMRAVYDVIVIDGPPRAEKSTAVLVSIADFILIPIQASIVDVWAVESALSWIQERQIITGGLPEARMMLSMMNLSSNRSEEISRHKDLLEYGVEFTHTGTVKRQDYERIFETGRTVFDLGPGNKARLEIQAIFEEVRDACRQ